MQVNDDSELLKLMMDDNHAAEDMYKPTNYWSVIDRMWLAIIYVSLTGRPKWST